MNTVDGFDTMQTSFPVLRENRTLLKEIQGGSCRERKTNLGPNTSHPIKITWSLPYTSFCEKVFWYIQCLNIQLLSRVKNKVTIIEERENICNKMMNWCLLFSMKKELKKMSTHM